jgi:uncharacterized SAM-binding protein YcdF (DUF218 family)
MIWETASILKHLLLPPLCLIWLAALAWIWLRRRPRAARWLLGISVLLTYLSSTPAVADRLMQLIRVEAQAPVNRPQAIVILGGGRDVSFDNAGKFSAAFSSADAIGRLLAGARLQRATGLPILVTGGSVGQAGPPEAQVMRDSLIRDFGVPVRWTESASRNTVENARFSAPTLHAAGISTIYLVTSAYHLRRARMLFVAQGFAVAPYPSQSPIEAYGPVPAFGLPPYSWRDLMPSIDAYRDTYLASNEIAGLVYAWSVIKFDA